jgi:membrane protease YdiL (CAAX protease family)
MVTSGRRKSLWLIVLFSVLVNAVAWLGPLLGGSPSSPGIGFIVWGTAPLLLTILLRGVTRDWSDFGISPAFKKNVAWYIVSLLAIPVLIVLAMLAGMALSITAISDFSLGRLATTTLTALPVFLIFAVFEEVGWRGYLAPKLASLGINRALAAALTGVVWASWHLPFIRELSWVYTPEPMLTFISRFYLTCVALSIIFGEIREISGSFWPAVIMHGVGNAFGHPLSADYVTVAAGWDFLGNISNGLLFITFAGLVGAGISHVRARNVISGSPA